MVENQSRDQIIVRTSIIGIIANILLASFKAIIGLLTNSIAITLDAVNNLSDAASSIITIIGTKLAGKEPNKKHPYGYGRIEYMSAMVISLIVLYAGITSLKESITKIVHPTAASYTNIALIIVAVAVLVKFVLGRFVKATGEKVNSGSLIASGTDASLDSVISLTTLIAALIFIFTGISLEAWLGAIISLVIIKSGIEILKDTISQLLGEQADPALVRDIKKTVNSFPEVSGAYDLILHNYGPDRYQGSIHIEICDTMTAKEIDSLIRRITNKVYQEHNIILTGVGLYAHNTHDDFAHELEEAYRKVVLAIPHVLAMHGFYFEEETKTVRFDAVVSFSSPSRKASYQEIVDKASALYTDYKVYVAMDMDYNEL